MSDEREPEFPPDEDEDSSVLPNAADRGSQRRIRDKGNRAEAEKQRFWREILGSEIGRREMWWLLHEQLHAFTTRVMFSRDGSSSCMEATFEERGMQRMGLQLYRLLQKYSLEGILAMHRENDPAQRPPPKPKRKVSKPDEPWPVENE